MASRSCVGSNLRSDEPSRYGEECAGCQPPSPQIQNNTRKRTVTATRKSQATMARAWFLTNVLQCCDEVPGVPWRPIPWANCPSPKLHPHGVEPACNIVTSSSIFREPGRLRLVNC